MSRNVETQIDILAEIRDALNRIASALEGHNNAAIRGISDDSDGQIEIFVTNHEG